MSGAARHLQRTRTGRTCELGHFVCWAGSLNRLAQEESILHPVLKGLQLVERKGWQSRLPMRSPVTSWST
jgi:hypothetical protein